MAATTFFVTTSSLSGFFIHFRPWYFQSHFENHGKTKLFRTGNVRFYSPKTKFIGVASAIMPNKMKIMVGRTKIKTSFGLAPHQPAAGKHEVHFMYKNMDGHSALFVMMQVKCQVGVKPTMQ
jgi:hypothetical protein